MNTQQAVMADEKLQLLHQVKSACRLLSCHDSSYLNRHSVKVNIKFVSLMNSFFNFLM